MDNRHSLAFALGCLFFVVVLGALAIVEEGAWPWLVGIPAAAYGVGRIILALVDR